MTVEEAQEIVRRLDPGYAAEIKKAGLAEAHYVWFGAAARLTEAQDA